MRGHKNRTAPSLARGIVVPSLTVFRDDSEQSIDERATCDHVEWLIDQGASGIVPGGSSGEFPALSHEETKRLISIVLRAVNRRVPVYAATGRYATQETIALTRHAEREGADGAMIVLPYYMRPSTTDVVRHFTDVRAVVDNHFSIILYNNPGTCGYELAEDDVAGLFDAGTIDAVKSSQGPATSAIDLMRRCPNLHSYYGHDFDAPAAAKAGVPGWLSGILNVFPRAAATLWWEKALWERPDGGKAWERAQPLADHVWRDHALHPVVAYKAALRLLGRPVGVPRRPLAGELTPHDRRVLARVLGAA